MALNLTQNASLQNANSANIDTKIMRKTTPATEIASLLLHSFFFFYRVFLAPLLLLLTGTPSLCRFQPTCSAYAQEAIAKHSWRGVMLAVKRLLRCRPTLFPSSEKQGMRWDPVPIKLSRCPMPRKTAKTKKLNY